MLIFTIDHDDGIDLVDHLLCRHCLLLQELNTSRQEQQQKESGFTPDIKIDRSYFNEASFSLLALTIPRYTN